MEERRMLTVICYDERIESVWKQYDRLFSTFLKKGKIAADVSLHRRKFPSPYASPCKEREKLLSVLLS